MPISVQCDNCAAKLQVREELAGKRVKCPKCSQPFKIPDAKQPAGATQQAKQPPSTATRTPAKRPIEIDDMTLAPAQPRARAHNPMLDLLDEAGVESAARGAVCKNCGSDMSALAIICIECGFNNETGKRLETTTFKSANEISADMTDGQKMMAKAEKEIEETPVSANEQDFGDGADSILIAAVAVVGALILTGLGVATIFIMDKIGENINTALISFFGAIGIYLFCAIWITVLAFRAKAIHGLACLFTGGLYCIVFGFMQGRALIVPTIICVFALVIGAISYVFSETGLA